MKPHELIEAAMDGKCVCGFHPYHSDSMPTDRMPAAFVASMQFRVVMNVLPKLKIYKPKKKNKSPWKQNI
jgi:hypothetical protein